MIIFILVPSGSLMQMCKPTLHQYLKNVTIIRSFILKMLLVLNDGIFAATYWSDQINYMFSLIAGIRGHSLTCPSINGTRETIYDVNTQKQSAFKGYEAKILSFHFIPYYLYFVFNSDSLKIKIVKIKSSSYWVTIGTIKATSRNNSKMILLKRI